MSVDTLRETFHINRIKPNSLDDFLTAQTYRPEITATFLKISRLKCQSLQALADNKISQGPTPVYANAGKPALKSKHTVDMITESPQGDLVCPNWADEKKKFLIKRNDLVITRKGSGTIGRASIFFGNDPLNSDDSLFKVTLSKVDASYVVSFLRSYPGQRLLEKGVYGSTGQLSLSAEHIRNLPIHTPDPLAQKYIGDKVRQAEQLRAWAKSIQLKVSKLLPSYINEIQRYKAKSYKAKDIIPERLDSLFYHPDYIVLESKMKAKGCKRLGLITKQVKDVWNKKKAEAFEYYEIGGLDITTGQVFSATTPTAGAPSRAKTKVQQGDVLVSTVRPNRKNIGFIVDNVAHSEMVATSGFSVLRFSSLTQAAFYHAWLRTDDATAQLMRWNSGSAYPAIDDDVPLNIIVPDFEKTFVDNWGQKLLDAHFAYVYAKMLTEAAKTLVEALIEGQLTEQQLIQAQQALEDGGNSLDQAILSKLSAEGYAIEGATPLFSDIDELYSLLEDAAQAEAEE
ncbi:restriction endonuclease subunit S [Pectobacterium versatile]|uniref:restriction endonuclease subunit S n=1 Tax=Pectobacterium versatile TaxID=2488639 RepID=UPI0020C01629|nr:restriction endonuclease subunit S [Pectobacterium versatile]